MKKNKIKQNAVDKPETDVDIKSLIHQHSLFFDKLINLIPAKFYLSTDDKEKKWFPGLSKDERAQVKKDSRENIKKARRERLDPGKATNTTTLDLVMQNLQNERTKDESDGEQVEINPMFPGMEGDDRAVTYEELRERLHRKMEELRAGRGGGGPDKRKKNDKHAKNAIQQKKRKRELGHEEKKADAKAEEIEKDITEATKELKFSNVRLGNEDRGKKKRKLSKLKELEKAKELAEAKKDPEKGGMISEKHSWKAAAQRAAGIKVHDNPKLLEQSLKRDKRKHKKNADKWKGRVENLKKAKEEKQQLRSQHISERIQQKRQRKTEKREKKLMQTRAGFEGRKEGYINGSST